MQMAPMGRDRRAKTKRVKNNVIRDLFGTLTRQMRVRKDTVGRHVRPKIASACRLSAPARRSPAHTMAASSAGCAWRATFASRLGEHPSPASRVRARASSPRSRASRSRPVLARASARVAPPPPADKPRHNRRGDNAERDAFADELRERNSGGRVSKRLWRAHVGKLSDPPAALADVTVILVGTKKAGNIGAVARACGSFECEDLRVVAPRADPYTRASLSAAKGAQHIVHGAGVYDTLDDALLDCGASVAFHVWCDGLDPERLRGIPDLLARFPGGVPGVPEPERDENGDALGRTETTDDGDGDEVRTDDGRDADVASSASNPGGWRVRRHVTPPANRARRGAGKLALVFGREVEGLTDDEVNACDGVCAIPTGRLVESLSVSHAAVIVLSQYFQNRQREEEFEDEEEDEEKRADVGVGVGVDVGVGDGAEEDDR